MMNRWGGNRYYIHARRNECIDFGIAFATVLFHNLLATIGAGVNDSHKIASFHLGP
jgi:hypothetical protein